MLLAPMHDELEPVRSIDLSVLSGDTLWRTVHDQIGPPEKVIESAGDGQACLTHWPDLLGRRGEKTDASCFKRTQSPVCGNVRHSGERHVSLSQHRGRHALADNAITVNRDANGIVVVHLRDAPS